MKIGISGLSSTGKTTLAQHVARVLQIPVCDEGMKDVYARRRSRGLNPPKFSDLSLDLKFDFQVEMIEHRCKAESDLKNFVGDGTPLDIMAFWLEWSTQISDVGYQARRDIIQRMDDLLSDVLDEYDMIFQLPFGVLPVQDDNRRITDDRFLRKINHLLISITQDHCKNSCTPRIHLVQHLAIPDRVEEVINVLHDSGLPPMVARA